MDTGWGGYVGEPALAPCAVANRQQHRMCARQGRAQGRRDLVLRGALRHPRLGLLLAVDDALRKGPELVPVLAQGVEVGVPCRGVERQRRGRCGGNLAVGDSHLTASSAPLVPPPGARRPALAHGHSTPGVSEKVASPDDVLAPSHKLHTVQPPDRPRINHPHGPPLQTRRECRAAVGGAADRAP